MALPHTAAWPHSNTIRVLLAEDMRLLRSALVSVLGDEEDIEVIADLKCDLKVVSVAQRLRPDVAVVSVDTAGSGDPTTVRELRRRLPDCRIVALTSPRPPGLLKRLLAENIPGLIDKNAPAARLLSAIRGVARGATVIDTNLLVAALAAGQNPFTPRELHVLRLAAAGASGPEIAKELSLSQGTVRNYLSSAMSKTSARTRIDAIRIATESGWL
ncbi:response regulator transcription factor [Actinophytocola sediminis]